MLRSLDKVVRPEYRAIEVFYYDLGLEQAEHEAVRLFLLYVVEDGSYHIVPCVRPSVRLLTFRVRSITLTPFKICS